MARERSRGRRRRLPAAERREQLLHVARGVFARRGVDAASIEEIAERAGVSRPIVYGHFGDKSGLFAVVVDREMQQVAARITEALAQGSPRQRFERGLLAFLAYVRDEPDGFALLSRHTPLRAEEGAVSSLLGQIADRVSGTLAPVLAANGFERRAAPIYAHALIGMATAVGLWWSERRRPSIEKVAAHVAALGWMGLRHLPRRPELVTDPRHP